MNSKTFLDIDETILMKNLMLPENTQKEGKLIKQSDSKPFFIIHPTPGICVKAKTEDGDKVFLNICTSDKIPPPEDISDTKLFEILSDENPQFVIPMSIGIERLESDKGGSPCATYDIAINVTYFEKCQNKKNFLLFTIVVIIDAVSNKFNKTLNTEDYVILRNRKAMGKLQQHRIENREPRTYLQTQKPLIEEIKSSIKDINEKRTESDQSLEKVSTDSIINSKSNYILLKQPSKGTTKHLIGIFKMPKGINGESVEVLLDRDRIVISVDNTSIAYDLSVPYIINIAHVKCLLDKDLRVLRVDMPVQGAADNISIL